MASILGSIDWGFQPLDWGSSDLGGAFWNQRGNYIKSANDPLRYQVVWTKGGVTEATEPSALSGTSTTGDVIYVKFIVQVCMNEEDANINGWETIAEITKTRDIANKRYNTDAVAVGHKFTVDVSQVVSSELSYSLCPIGKGTWQSNKYGGMNGGQVMQDNVISNNASYGNPVSNYNVSKNGAWRRLQVIASPYIINDAGDILYASNSQFSEPITIINSVNQFEQDSVYYSSSSFGGYFRMYETASASTYQSFKFLSRYDNYSYDSSAPYCKKPIRIDEAAECLNFYFMNASSNNIAGTEKNAVRAIGIKVETFTSDGSAENTFYLNDFESHFITALTAGGKEYIRKKQDAMFTQNISPSFINDHATCKSYNDSGSAVFPYWTTYSGSKITSSTAYYRVSIRRFGEYDPTATRRTSEYRYYTIDREDEKAAYAFVRFHWLNDLGAIDSYTAKRNISEGYSIGKDIIERKSVDRTWYQGNENGGVTLADGIYISDTMRGGDIYKGGREVMNVNAERNLSVYTEPLNDKDSKWLAKMMLSPNVWVEMDTQATKIGNNSNPYLRPSTKEYIPVIITNSDVETVNQEQGLVSFNIEYTLSHKVITQTN